MKSPRSAIRTQSAWRSPFGPKERLSLQDNQMILIGLMVPTMMVVLNFTMFGVALPTIRSVFHIQADVVALVMTAYTLPFMIATPLYGRLGDELGKRRLFLAGIMIFLVGTLITVSATQLRFFMLGRLIQGLGAAGVVPLCMATISQIFPVTERGKALGTWNSIGPISGIGGPFLAGLLVDYLGWRTIFGPIFLVGIAALLVIRGQVPQPQQPSQPRIMQTFDWGGVALLIGAVTSLIFYLTSQPVTGVAALRDWRLLGLTILFFGAFVIWERRHAAPFIALNIFADKTFSRASFSAGARMFAMSGIGFLMPLYLADIHTVSASLIGIILMTHAGALLITMRIGGQLADRWNSRWPVISGMTIQVGSMLSFALLPATMPLWIIVTSIIVHGLGAGLSLAALHRASMGRIPQEQAGMAAGLYSMVRFGGTLLGPALGGVALQLGLDRSLLPIEAYHGVFGLIASVAVLGVISGLGLRE